MTDLNQQIPNTTQPETVAQPVESPKNEPLQKVKDILMKVFNKLYSNKMIFWSVSSFLGIVLLIVVLGLLFGKGRSKVTQVHTASPKPFVLSTPTTNISNDIISTSQEKLIKFKKEIDALDVKQGRLSPPSINFEVKF